ncbi:MAG: HAMP domain-containing protein [Clostridiales bacterium]|jgi:two-component system sensor histidine kinase ResE|nr:HAMP domain-containing protein [Clostridiales bacterium]
MKSNIFTKLLTTYLVIILITLLVVGLLLPQLIQNYYYNARERELAVKGQEIAGIFTNFMLGFQDQRTTDDLLFALERFLDAHVIPVDRNTLLLASSDGFNHIGLRLTPFELDDVLRGEIVSKRGFHDHTREQLITVAVPMWIMDQVVGAIFLHAPLTGIAGTVSQVRVLIVYAAVLATFLSMLVGFYMSKSISHPLQQMNRAALEVAGGNYQQQVEVSSSDEVGQLAQTFNYMSSTLQQTVEALSQEKTKLENIMLSMNEGVIAIDRQGQGILANPQARLLLGLTEEDLTGKDIASLLKNDDISSLLMSASGTGTLQTGKFTIANGRILSLQVAPLRQHENVWGAVGIIQDVTERDYLEGMRRDFVANVSHELRTPMTSIQGFVEALIDGLAEDKESEDRYLNVILDETVRLNRLVNDLLDLSRLETGQLKWPMEPVSLHPLLNQVVTKLQNQFEKQQIQAVIDCPEKLPAVLGNRDRIQQVLINLLGNAISFTPSGGKITLIAREDGEMIRISVSDTGIGIPAAEQDKIWDRFHKVDRARTRSLGGTGLGLSIVKQIVDAHGGTVGLYSTLGAGSTFHFSLNKYETN